MLDYKFLYLTYRFPPFNYYLGLGLLPCLKLRFFTRCPTPLSVFKSFRYLLARREVKAGKGGFSGGRPPYGYEVVDKKLIIIPEEAQAVRDIFEMRDDGMVLADIADKLNDKGLKTKRGGKFRTSTIQTIVYNRKTYEGFYKYGDSDWVVGQHTAILGKGAIGRI